MGYIWAIYYLYLLTYLLTTSVSGRVPVVLPDGYPCNKLPGYSSPTHKFVSVVLKVPLEILDGIFNECLFTQKMLTK